MEQFDLNTIPGKVAPVCHASQYDTGRIIRVNLFEGDQVYTLDGTEVVSISVRKPDGHVVTEAITNTSAAYVEIITTEQMTACFGANLCELKIEKGADTIGTLNFILSVEEDPLAGGDPSESFVYNLATQIYNAVADQYDSNNVIFDAAPTPGHGVPYTVTSEGIDAAMPKDLDDLSDVTTSTPSSGEVLTYDGTKWTNTALELDDISDVDVTGATNGQALCYDSNTDKWVPVGVASYGDTLPMSTTDPDKVADRITACERKIAYKYYSINNIDVYRSGNVVFFNIITGTNTTDANGLIVSGGSNAIIKSGYKPVNNVNVLDTVSGNRMTCNADGTVWTGNVSQSGISYRISACWITTDTMPT